MTPGRKDAWLDSCSISEGDEEPDILGGEGIEDGTLAGGRSVVCVAGDGPWDKTASNKGLQRQSLRLRQHVGLPASVYNARVVSRRDALKSSTGSVESGDSNSEPGTDDEEEDSSEGDGGFEGLQDADESEGLGVNFGGGSEDSVSEGDVALDDDNIGAFPLVSAELLKEQQRLERDAEVEQEIIKKRDKEAEARLRETAAQTKNQMTVWAGLLTARIQLQGIVSSSRCLSQTEGAGSRTGLEARAAASADVARVFLTLRHVQQKLIANHPELNSVARIGPLTTSAAEHADIGEDAALEESWKCARRTGFLGDRKRRRVQLVRDDPSCRAEDRVWQQIDVWPRKLKQWCLGVVDHWHAEVNATAQQHFKVLDQSPSAQLERVMQTDAERLLKASYRAGALSAKSEESEPADAEKDYSYQDTEFYAVLLRDAVAATKGEYGVTQGTVALLEGAGASGLLQRLKARDEEKRKKDIERRASKGRKIRYVPIPKLVHFMTPRPLESSTLYGGRVDHEGESPEQEAYISQFIASLFQQPQG